MSDDSSLSASEQSAFQMNDFDDLTLTEIFKRLPPYDRLLLRLICKRWKAINDEGWPDIVHLDLKSIPGPNIKAVIKRSPNLSSIIAAWKAFRPAELRVLSRLKLASVKLYNCSCPVDVERDTVLSDAFATVFSADAQTAQWEELVLHDFWASAETEKDSCPLNRFIERKYPRDPNSPHASLASPFSESFKRLQIDGVQGTQHSSSSLFSLHRFAPRFERLVNLECLILQGVALDALAFRQMSELINLRELSLGPVFVADKNTANAPPPLPLASRLQNAVSLYGESVENNAVPLQFAFSLPRLEALFLNSILLLAPAAFPSHLTTHPSLRVLVLAGFCREAISLKKRDRFPNGFGAPPVQQLHVFLGREASRKVRIEPSTALEIHPISEPLPKFLDSEENAEIFKGVWIAERICEGAKHGAKLFDYDGDVVL